MLQTFTSSQNILNGYLVKKMLQDMSYHQKTVFQHAFVKHVGLLYPMQLEVGNK